MTAVTHPTSRTRPRPAPGAPDALFLVWGPRAYGPRSRVFARALGIEVHHVVWTSRRGALVAPFKYAAQGLMTLWLLARRRPRVVLVQSPPTLAVLCALLYTRLGPGAGFVVDAHSDAFTSRLWTRPAWFRRWLTSRAIATVVTGEQAAASIRGDGGRAIVVPDVPAEQVAPAPVDLGDGFHVAVVSSFAPDEPLEAIAIAAARLPDIHFHVTGPSSRARHRLPDRLPPNLELTGFLPEDAYVGLLAACHGVLCLTTRDHTMQRGACEALALGTPVVTSRWPLLEAHFDRGAVHVTADPDDITRGLDELRSRHAELAQGIRELRHRHAQDWAETRGRLLALLDDGPSRGR